MKLTDPEIKAAKPKEKPYSLPDGGGLVLYVQPSGAKWWRYRYRFNGTAKMLSIGVYPDVTLKEARNQQTRFKELLGQGSDPSIDRKLNKQKAKEVAANSFESVAREWFSKHRDAWASDYAKRVMRMLERDCFPTLGGRPITEIAAPDLLAVLRKIEGRGALRTAHKTLGLLGQIFRYAVATGRAERDPSGDLRGSLAPVKVKHHAAILDLKELGYLLRAIDDYEGHFATKCALQLLPLVFTRPIELRHARWQDINFETAEWRYTITKTQTAHVVPLARQAVEILQSIQPLTGDGEYVFPNLHDSRRPLSENIFIGALRRMGIAKNEMSAHGFRAVARTLLDEVLSVRPDYIEHQLGHSVRDPNGRAYNRTAHLEERRKMMQQWADYLDKLKGSE